jgi:hypothetical protein
MMFPDPSNDKQRAALRLAAERASASRNTQSQFEQRIPVSPDQFGRRFSSGEAAFPDSQRVQQR